MPHLCQAVDDERINGKAIVTEVVGDLANAHLSEYIKSVCAKQDKTVTVDEVHLTPLSLKYTAEQFSSNGLSC